MTSYYACQLIGSAEDFRQQLGSFVAHLRGNREAQLIYEEQTTTKKSEKINAL